jgi:LPXTG-motif cell wall-anchored protein
VASTVSESRTDNNTDGAEVTGEGAIRPPGTLPRTGAGIGALLVAGLALITGGGLLRRRSRSAA